MSRAFGEFDPRFLGVSLIAPSESRLRLIYQYTLGPETITDRDAARLDDEQFLEQVSSITLLTHEFRHFHDHIISPYGSRVMHARCTLAFNTAMLLVAMRLQQDNANVLPAPLSTWCRMPFAERDAFIAELNAAVSYRGGHFIAPHLPLLSEDGEILSQPADQQPSEFVCEVVRGCAQARRALDSLQALPPGITAPRDINASLIWEASAVLVQCQEVKNAIGEMAAQRFVDILTSGSRNRYGTALRTMLGLFDAAGVPADIDTVLQFVLWCLLGNPYEDKQYASPVIRLAKLSRVLLEQGTQAVGSSARDNYELWDRATGSTATLSSLSDSLDRDQLFHSWLLQKLADAGREGEDRIIAEAIELFEQFIEARRYLIDLLQADPGMYASPSAYLSSLPELSAPPVKIVVESGGMVLPDDFEDNGGQLYAGKQVAATGRTAGVIFGPQVEMAGRPHIDRKTAFDAYTLFTMSDILFGPDVVDVPQSDWENARDQLTDGEMRLLRINR